MEKDMNSSKFNSVVGQIVGWLYVALFVAIPIFCIGMMIKLLF